MRTLPDFKEDVNTYNVDDQYMFDLPSLLTYYNTHVLRKGF